MIEPGWLSIVPKSDRFSSNLQKQRQKPALDMRTEKDRRHQIRLSGDPAFQDRLRRARVMLCRINVSDGRLNEVASIALRIISSDEIVSTHRSGVYLPNAPHAVAPDPLTIQISGEAAQLLVSRRSDMIERGEAGLNFRAIIHNAICALADKDESLILYRLGTNIS